MFLNLFLYYKGEFVMGTDLEKLISILQMLSDEAIRIILAFAEQFIGKP